MEKKIYNIVAKLNEDLNEYYAQTDNSEVLEIGTTIIGMGGIIKYEIFKTLIKRTETSGSEVFVDRYAIAKEWDMYELKGQIQHDRIRLRKSWKVWKSENPDLEMEREDDDEE